MNPLKAPEAEAINLPRRNFFGTAAMTIAAAQLVMAGSTNAQSTGKKPGDLPKIQPGANTSFGPLKQIDAGVLSIGYAEAGPADGPTVILLHGWPYDIHSFVDVAPLLAAAGGPVSRCQSDHHARYSSSGPDKPAQTDDLGAPQTELTESKPGYVLIIVLDANGAS